MPKFRLKMLGCLCGGGRKQTLSPEMEEEQPLQNSGNSSGNNSQVPFEDQSGFPSKTGSMNLKYSMECRIETDQSKEGSPRVSDISSLSQKQGKKNISQFDPAGFEVSKTIESVEFVPRQNSPLSRRRVDNSSPPTHLRTASRDRMSATSLNELLFGNPKTGELSDSLSGSQSSLQKSVLNEEFESGIG